MPRKPHYWKHTGRTACPDNFVVFDTETLPYELDGHRKGELHKLRLGCMLWYRLEKGKRTRQGEFTFRRKESFWHKLEELLQPSRMTTIIGHNLPFDLGAVGGYDRLSRPDCLWEHPIFEHGIFHLRGTIGGMPVTFLDSGNYYKCSLKSIGKAVGLPKQDMPDWSAPDLDWEQYCRNDVYVTALGMDRLIEFWREHELGPWGITIASLAFNAFRHRFMRDKVLVHDDKRALQLEREAYYGGRVDTPFIGEVPASPVYEFDFSSLYPSTYYQDMPHKLLAVDPRPTINTLNRLGKGYHAIARVELDTNLSFPYRGQDKRVIHPVGRYTTTLAWPELQIALQAGVVVRVLEAAVYETATIFRPYADFFYPLKQHYERQGNDAFRTICKYLLNALYGKAGQMSPCWLPWGDYAFRVLEEQYGLAKNILDRYGNLNMSVGEIVEVLTIKEIPEPLQIRRYWGYPEVCVKKVESRDSCPAIAATVTSYARCKLTVAQEAAGRGHWFYSDTDSVWVDMEGRTNLLTKSLTGHDIPGKLELKREVAKMVIHGRKDYECDTDRRLKGIRPNAKEICHGVYEQLHFPSAVVQLQDRISDGVFVRKVLKHLRRNVDWCVKHPDGTTSPIILGTE